MRDTVYMDASYMDASVSDEAYQDQILPHVSRTFALTIPQLPPGLRLGVTNAYLLCRIADTIEDQTNSSAAQRLGLLHRFVAVVAGQELAAQLAQDLLPRLAEGTLPAERELVLNMGRVVRLTAALDPLQRTAIERCVRVMCEGMHHFQRIASVRGLERMADLDDYCYYVAGVVGEMLTQLFCAYSPAIDAKRAPLEKLSVSFAEGLQLTNILKDVWEDRERGACWLPREIFEHHGVALETLQAQHQPAGFAAGMRELVGIAHAHLRDALSFTLLLPQAEVGIRRFCLWAIGLAVLTLRSIEQTPGFTSGSQVKISHAAVAVTQVLSNAGVRHDWLLRRLFDLAAAGLPRAPPGPPYVAGTLPAGDAVAQATPLQDFVDAVPQDLRREGSSGR
jgi:farnesyl-diphosphate farnesyltransferase